MFASDCSGAKKYLYCLQWSMLVDAESRCEGIFAGSEEETEEEFLRRVCTQGVAVSGARIVFTERGSYAMTWRVGSGKTWKVGAQLMLSRTGVGECENKKLIIEARTSTRIFSPVTPECRRTLTKGNGMSFRPQTMCKCSAH